MPRLQIRQGIKRVVDPQIWNGQAFVIDWGSWLDVPSPYWLLGFILPDSDMVYEFRTTTEGD